MTNPNADRAEELLECLCERPNKDEPRSHVNLETGCLKLGHERTCKIVDGKGSCGEPFYLDKAESLPCQWCCQIIKVGVAKGDKIKEVKEDAPNESQKD